MQQRAAVPLTPYTFLSHQQATARPEDELEYRRQLREARRRDLEEKRRIAEEEAREKARKAQEERLKKEAEREKWKVKTNTRYPHAGKA